MASDMAAASRANFVSNSVNIGTYTSFGEGALVFRLPAALLLLVTV